MDFETLAKESHKLECTFSIDEENSGNDFPSGVIVAFYVLLFSITVTVFQNLVGLIGIFGSLAYIIFVIWDYKSIS